MVELPHKTSNTSHTEGRTGPRVVSVEVFAARPIVADGLAGWLRDSPNWTLSGIVTESSVAIRAFHDSLADIAIVTDDMHLDALLGLGRGLATGPIVIAACESAEPDEEAYLVRAGAAAVLALPTLTRAQLTRAVEDVRQGRRVLSAEALTTLMRPDEPLGDLSDRQREVARFLMKGRSVRWIAEYLAVSESTVKTHMARIERRLGVSGREPLAEELTQLVRAGDIQLDLDRELRGGRFVHGREVRVSQTGADDGPI